MNRLKNQLYVLTIGIIATSCYFSDYESDMVISPTKQYYIKAKVNRTKENQKDYADVIIYLYDKDKTEIINFNSKAGDANKWSLGWSKIGDTILLQSNDIGNQAWIIKNKTAEKIRLTKSLNEQAEELYRKKYK